MNVSDLTPKRVLENEELCSIMNSIGLVIGQKPIRANLRYGKVYIATDMDQDGSNIAALLINFFYKFFPDLFDPKEPPFFHIFLTPFIIAEKGKTRKYWYGNDVHEFDSFDSKGWAITRAKGLGTLLPVDWEYALTNPRVIQIFDDGKMKSTLDLIFNNKRADDRKLWMSGEFDV
jgi:DNA gyrase/topoisomerase IV subunit B